MVPWQVPLSASYRVPGGGTVHDWVEPPEVLTRRLLFDTQYPVMLWNIASVEPVLRSAVKWSKLTVLPALAMTAGRASPEPTCTELPVNVTLFALWMYQPYAGRVPMLFGL